MQKLKYLIPCLLLGLTLSTQSCKKAEDAVTTASNASEVQTVSTENANADKDISEGLDISTEAINNRGGLNKTEYYSIINTACATITVADSGTFPAKPAYITIRFDSTLNNGQGCLGRDGRYRKGTIAIKVENARFSDKGSVTTIRLINYSVDSFNIEGTHVVTNLGKPTTGADVEYHSVITGGKRTSPKGKVTTWAADRTWDVYYVTGTKRTAYALITGSSNGVTSTGKAFTQTINNALKVVPGCRWIEAGSVTESVPSSSFSYTVKFDRGGGCDRKADVIYNGVDYPIEL